MKYRLIFLPIIIILGTFSLQNTYAQNLKLKARKSNALGGKAFALSISDSTLTLQQREEIIFNEIKKGNVPNFLRKFKQITQGSGWDMGDIEITIQYLVLPDYFAIGSDDDFFYVPMTPILAQKVADLLKCSLPTKKMVDTIYKNATIKLEPIPVPPTKAMTTVPIFIAHSDLVIKQLFPFQNQHINGELTAGNKKDLIISNKIYTEKTPKVVIYGWHKMDGKAIQPVYNKHTNLWADYSHGVRFVSQKLTIITNGFKQETTIKKVLTLNECYLLSDEGPIKKPYYPITAYQ
jgi:hypothetical protein